MNYPPLDLDGKVAVVIGGTSGIGRVFGNAWDLWISASHIKRLISQTKLRINLWTQKQFQIF